ALRQAADDARETGIPTGSRHHAAEPGGPGLCRSANRYADVAGLADAAGWDRSGRDSAAGGAARAQRRNRHRQRSHPWGKPDVAEIRSAGRVRSRALGWALPRPTAEMVRHALYGER